jgi:hypothetical protein
VEKPTDKEETPEIPKDTTDDTVKEDTEVKPKVEPPTVIEEE